GGSDQGRAAQLLEDRRTPDRRHGVASPVHMVDVVLVVHDGRDRLVARTAPVDRLLVDDVPRRSEPNRIVAERLDDLRDVAGRTAVLVLALEDRPHDFAYVLAPRQLAGPE